MGVAKKEWQNMCHPSTISHGSSREVDVGEDGTLLSVKRLPSVTQAVTLLTKSDLHPPQGDPVRSPDTVMHPQCTG